MTAEQIESQHDDWTTETLAQAAGISQTSYIRRLCLNGTLQARKLGRDWIIAYEEGLRWLTARTAKRSKHS